jgi:hypothetical protein
MKSNKTVRPIKLLITTEQFAHLIDKVLCEQEVSNKKKLIKSTTNGKKK